MWGRVTYREKAAVPSVNEVEGRVGKPSFRGDVVKLEDDVLWRAPCGNRSYVGAFSTLR